MLDWAQVDMILGELTREGEDALEAAGVPGAAIRLRFGADLRYVGQQNEVAVDLPHDPRAARDVAGLRTAFAAAYHAHYGVNPSHVPVELVSWRVTAEGPRPAFGGSAPPPRQAEASKATRVVGLWREAGDVPVHDRGALRCGQAIAGPAIIEERETTVVLPPGWQATVDPIGCIVARRS